MKKVLFIDRDGTLIHEPVADPQIDSLDELKFVPGVFTWLGKIARETDYELVMVTNQDGLGTASFPEETFWPVQNMVIETLAGEGIHFAGVHVDRSLPNENKPTRKPGTGMLGKYFSEEYDLKNSIVIGEIHEAVLPARSAQVQRTTKETDINVSVKLNGTGKSSIQTGLGFFDHMLDQLSRHGLVDLDINVKGDLHIDEHHTIEDTGLALGEAFSKALGDKRGIERYGFCLPMDDCLAQVAIDFGGRPWLEWDAEFKREKIGEMPTEMFFHFFKSFSDTAKCNLNIKAEGANEHHKIEAIFKSFAKAVKMAVRKDPFNDQLPSTKGTL
jgi:imidazoleglycerol-phosphate dehydratase/histidinol-phosphatase